MINEAIAFAMEAHKGQFRKGTDIPYIFHPMEVGAIVARITSDSEVIAAAVLHDTVEDCETVTVSIIREKFGDRVADIVDAESENKSDSWEKRKGDKVRAILEDSNTDRKIIALADKLSNARSMYKDYARIGDELWLRFNMKDKGMQRWYYNGLKNALKNLEFLQEYQEFARYVDLVFE